MVPLIVQSVHSASDDKKAEIKTVFGYADTGIKLLVSGIRFAATSFCPV